MNRYLWMRSSALLVLAVGCLVAILLVSCSPDHGLGPTVQGIRGTVHFHGVWPEDLLEVRVVVFKTYPPESFFALSGFSDAIPLLSDAAAYEVMLAPGEYGFVGVACRKSPDWDTGCVLGFYHVPGDPQTPQPVTVGSGEFAEGVDITLEFGTIARGPLSCSHGNSYASRRGWSASAEWGYGCVWVMNGGISPRKGPVGSLGRTSLGNLQSTWGGYWQGGRDDNHCWEDR
jgi:hypothetical protein